MIISSAISTSLSDGAAFADRLHYGVDHLTRVAAVMQRRGSRHRVVHFDTNPLAEHCVPDRMDHSLWNALGNS
jgi:hypothetical protein